MNSTTKKLTQVSLIAAVALVLSAIEMMLPDLPFMVPGMKLGLSNITIMFALFVLDLPSAFFIVFVKSMLALFMRGTTSFLMSLAGGIISTLIMYLLINIKKPKFGYIGIGVEGAFFHNFAQLMVAFLFTDKTIFFYLPFISAASLVSGSITALVLSLLLPPLMRLSLFGEYS